MKNLTSQKPPFISIVIPHYNGIKILNDCLTSLSQSTYENFEIVLVDNASTDGSDDFVKKNFPDVRIIQNTVNLGFAGGCNVGILNASADLVLVLNNDTIHKPDWIDFLVDAIQQDEKIAAVQPKLLSYHNRAQFDYSGGCGGFLDKYGFPLVRGRVFDTLEKDVAQYEDVIDIFWASGTAFLARKEDILHAGLFDETFFAHMEEIDLDWRLHLMDKRIVVQPKAVVYHHSGYTLSAQSLRKKYLNHRNSFLMVLANYSLMSLIPILPVRLLLELLAFGWSMLTGDINRAAAIIKSLAWIVLHPGVVAKKRRKTAKIRIINDRDLTPHFIRGSVSLGYFLLKKRTFSKWRK